MLPYELTRREQRILRRLAERPSAIDANRSDTVSVSDLIAIGLVERTGRVCRLTLRGQIAAAKARPSWLERLGFSFG